MRPILSKKHPEAIIYKNDASANIKKSTSNPWPANKFPKMKLNMIKLEEYLKKCFSKIIFKYFLSDFSRFLVSTYLYSREYL
ncbi:hypothetical protein ES703_21181 [subsurface metagenome]